MTTITITDRDGATIEVECDIADFERLVVDRADLSHPVIVGKMSKAPEFTVTRHIGVTMSAAFSDVCSLATFEPPDPIQFHRVHAPAPSSARWEGPAPKQRRGR